MTGHMAGLLRTFLTRFANRNARRKLLGIINKQACVFNSAGVFNQYTRIVRMHLRLLVSSDRDISHAGSYMYPKLEEFQDIPCFSLRIPYVHC